LKREPCPVAVDKVLRRKVHLNRHAIIIVRLWPLPGLNAASPPGGGPAGQESG